MATYNHFLSLSGDDFKNRVSTLLYTFLSKVSLTNRRKFAILVTSFSITLLRRISAMADTFKVLNPATGEVVEEVRNNTEAEVLDAIERGHKAFKTWSKTTAYHRSALILKWVALIEENMQELAELLTKENGKPLAESIGELKSGNSYITWYAEEAKRIYGRTVPADVENKRIFVTRQPIGMVASITPWNFPSSMLSRKAAPALAAGCTFITKPASETPLSTMRLVELAHEAGIPKDVIQYVNGGGREIGELFTSSPYIRKITFTGSTPVGKLLVRNGADTLKHMTMELGGHAPFIVTKDADIDLAVEETMFAKYRNAGQACIAANRFIVHEDVAEEFGKKLAAKTAELKVGNGLEEGVDIGPLINKSSFDKIKAQIDDAKAKGATVLAGDKYDVDEEKEIYYLYPTVLTGVTKDMVITREETFGPVAPIMTFKTLEEAVEMANDTEYGLAGYFFTNNYKEGLYLNENIEFGIVGWNNGAVTVAQAPFGGMKDSGMGREGGPEGIEPYLETKYTSIQF